ncbi:hypothetical protein HAX54_013575 [Datura stramonium]|uniref:TPX2 C-terminal domain-containing protein n=1 Tax=Datura stramonium TaxID=4076 RepID=A0ABS8RYL2_DATST|nr:hypothetical protein [Datura stramonium]
MSTKDIRAIEEGNCSTYTNEEGSSLCTSPEVVIIIQKVIAEAIGTYFLIFVGCGAVAVNKTYGSVTFPGICAAWGLIVMVMVYAVGHISGAHFNPAVTIAFAIFRHFPFKQVPLYILAQLTGAILGSGTLYLLLDLKTEAFFGTAPVGSNVQSLILEFIISYLLMFVISGVATDNRSIGELAGIAIGMTILLNVLIAGPVSGASMNPARSIGPAIVMHQYRGLWIYIVGPILGTIVGGFTYNLIRILSVSSLKFYDINGGALKRISFEMAGDIEEPFRLSFQADSWQSGSISFGRFENEALCWERRSSFTHNRYLEEVEKYSKPGSVTEKKAYFEARFRRKALLRQSSSDWQNGAESQASENDGPENTGYEGDFEHVNEIGHSACFVESHDRSANLLENEKYQASENDVTENEGYGGDFEHVNEVGHSARFDENHDRSTHLSKNEKCQAENTGYDGDFEIVNEVGDSARFEESLDGSHDGDIEVTECGGEDSIILHSGSQTEQAANNSHVLQSVPEHLEAEANFLLDAGNSAYPVPEIEVKEKLEGQDSSMEFSSNSVDLSSNAHTTEKDGSVSSEPQRSSSSKVRTASQSRNTKSRMLSQVSVASGKGTISKQAYKDMPRKPNRRHSDASLTQKGEKPGLDAPGALLRPTARMPKPEVCSGSKANVHNLQKSTEQQPRARKAVASRASCTEKVNHRVHQSVNRDKQSVISCQPGMKQNGSTFRFKSEERAKKRKEFFMKLEEKVHAKEEETHQLQARTQEKKEAEIKQLRRSLNFKATPMPAFYREPSRRSEKNKELASNTKSGKSQSRPSTPGARATSATANNVPCSRAEIDNRWNVADSPQVSEVTNHPSAELSDSSVPSSAPTSKTSLQTRSNRTVAPKREQEKRQVLNSPRPRTSDTNNRNKDSKAEEKKKVVARRTGNSAMRKDIRSIDLSHSTRVGRLAVGVAS